MDNTRAINPAVDGLEIYSRLFNHRPFLKGEIENFIKNFEEKRGDREIENIFGILERVSELRDFGVGKLESNLAVSCTNLIEKLVVAETRADRILTAAHSHEIEKSILSSRDCREAELAEFSRDLQKRYKRIDEKFLEREEDLKRKYTVD